LIDGGRLPVYHSDHSSLAGRILGTVHPFRLRIADRDFELLGRGEFGRG